MALAYCLLYGATDEIHQAFVPNRQSDIFDWIADATGALMALAFIRLTIATKLGGILFGREIADAA